LINVKVAGVEVKGSPFLVDVRSGAFNENTTASGDGINDGVIAGKETMFQIIAKDKNNEIRKFEDDFDIIIENGKTSIESVIKSNNDGTYDVKYTAPEAGMNIINIKLNGDHILDSPFYVNVEDGADTEQSKIENLNNGKTGEINKFSIIPIDKNGDQRFDGKDNVSVEINGKQYIVPEIFKNLEKGTFDVEFLPIKPGDYEIAVKLNNKSMKPLKLNIKTGANPKTTYIDGFEKGLKPGSKTKFVIHSNDKDGNPRDYCEDDFDIKIDGPQNISSYVLNNGDGTYDVKYSPSVPGKYTVSVKANNENVKGSPYEVNVEEGADIDKVTVEYNKIGNPTGNTSNFIISSFDKNGNLRKESDEFFIDIDGPEQIIPNIKRIDNKSVIECKFLSK
jgi:hypothetical protein